MGNALAQEAQGVRTDPRIGWSLGVACAGRPHRAGPSAGAWSWRSLHTDNRRSLVSEQNCTRASVGPPNRVPCGWIPPKCHARRTLRCFHERVDLSLQSLSDVLDQADYRVRSGSHAPTRVWPTGFDILDRNLTGGFRSGELVLLGGPQGLGKTTWVLQVARNVARSGRSVVFFSFEHDLQTLLIRLVALEAGTLDDPDAPSINRIRQSFEGADGLSGSLSNRLSDTAGGGKALEIIQEYADRLMLHRSTGTTTDLEVIKAAVERVREDTGHVPLVVVDYLQKVYVPSGQPEESERITLVVEGLKDMALDYDVPVLAVVASDKEGLNIGKRMRVNNLRGSSALAYEADTVLLLNNKYDVVARHHLVYSIGNAESFKHWAILSIEKNRSGMTGVDMEFHKRFDQSRFETEGRPVVEQLIDERVFTE